MLFLEGRKHGYVLCLYATLLNVNSNVESFWAILLLLISVAKRLEVLDNQLRNL